MKISLEGREATEFHAQTRKHRRRSLLALVGAVSAILGIARGVRGCVKLGTKQQLFATCDEGRDCASGVCVVHSGDVLGQCSKECETNAECGTGARCTPIAYERYCVLTSPDGAPCYDGEACKSGVCEADPGDPFMGRCARGCGDDGSACLEGRYCDRTDRPHGCAAQKQAGLPCGADNECLSGACASADDSIMKATARACQ